MLFSVLLSGEKALLDWPKKGDQGLRQQVYRKLRSDIYDLKEVHDPIVGQKKKRIVEKKNNCIVVKKSEVSQLVNSAYHETKGEGAKKIKQTNVSYLLWVVASNYPTQSKFDETATKSGDPFFIIRRLSDQSKHPKYKKGIKWILLVWLACQAI